MRGILITGTDTGVGKTIISGLLGRYLEKSGYKVITQKWVQTGSKGCCCDIDLHLKLMNRQRKQIKPYLSYVSPYTFGFGCSPHLAASLERRKINPERIKESFRFLSQRFDFVVVEGIGGALVPFDRNSLLIDIAAELDLAVLIVVANKLGAINHTLLTIEAIKKRKIKIAGIIFNNKQKKENKLILDDNVRIIKALTKERVLGTLRWIEDKKRLYQEFIPIGKKTLAQLKKSSRND